MALPLRIRATAFACALSLLVIGFGVRAEAAVLLVPSEYATIQAGVDAASSGDSVFVAAGVYPEAVVITGKYVHLEGAASDSVTIDGLGLNAPCITIDGPGGGQTVVRGFTLYRADCPDGALSITNGASALVEACCVAYSRSVGAERGTVNVTAGSVAAIRGSRILGNHGNTCGGVVAISSTIELTGNLIVDNFSYAFNGHGAVYASNCITVLRHNTILSNEGSFLGNPLYSAIYTRNGVSITMIENVVAFNSGYGVALRDPISYNIQYTDAFGNALGGYRSVFWSVDPGASLTNISVDPQLVAPEYIPQPGSPVFGAGPFGSHIGLDSAAAPCWPDAVGPICGNGILEFWEQCDDSNTVPGDGCSATCRRECPIVLTGDVNISRTITSADIIWLVGFVFRGGAAPLPCLAAGDCNCSGTVTSADIITLVGYIFRGGAPPCDGCTSPLASQC